MSSNLSVRYMGFELDSPVVVGACPLTIQPETVRQLIEAGAGAIVLPSILREQIVYWQMKPNDPLNAIENSGYQPQQDKYNGGVEAYLDTIRCMKRNHDVPIFASINAGEAGDWIQYTQDIEANGADALELNWQPGVMSPERSADQIEEQLCETVRRVCSAVRIPVAVKLNQRFTNLASIAHKVQDVGASGLVLFTHLPHWDVSIDRMHWTICWELSPVDSLGGILEGIVRSRTGGLEISLAASGGIRTGEDAIKAMIAGADVAMVTSEIYREGPDAVRKIVDSIRWFVDKSPHQSLHAFQQSRPPVQMGSDRLMRLEHIDPLTRSQHYTDPTPVVAANSGDQFGHQSGR